MFPYRFARLTRPKEDILAFTKTNGVVCPLARHQVFGPAERGGRSHKPLSMSSLKVYAYKRPIWSYRMVKMHHVHGRSHLSHFFDMR